MDLSKIYFRRLPAGRLFLNNGKRQESIPEHSYDHEGFWPVTVIADIDTVAQGSFSVPKLILRFVLRSSTAFMFVNVYHSCFISFVNITLFKNFLK